MIFTQFFTYVFNQSLEIIIYGNFVSITDLAGSVFILVGIKCISNEIINQNIEIFELEIKIDQTRELNQNFEESIIERPIHSENFDSNQLYKTSGKRQSKATDPKLSRRQKSDSKRYSSNPEDPIAQQFDSGNNYVTEKKDSQNTNPDIHQLFASMDKGEENIVGTVTNEHYLVNEPHYILNMGNLYNCGIKQTQPDAFLFHSFNTKNSSVVNQVLETSSSKKHSNYRSGNFSFGLGISGVCKTELSNIDLRLSEDDVNKIICGHNSSKASQKISRSESKKNWVVNKHVIEQNNDKIGQDSLNKSKINVASSLNPDVKTGQFVTDPENHQNDDFDENTSRTYEQKDNSIEQPTQYRSKDSGLDNFSPKSKTIPPPMPKTSKDFNPFHYNRKLSTPQQKSTVHEFKNPKRHESLVSEVKHPSQSQIGNKVYVPNYFGCSDPIALCTNQSRLESKTPEIQQDTQNHQHLQKKNEPAYQKELSMLHYSNLTKKNTNSLYDFILTNCHTNERQSAPLNSNIDPKAFQGVFKAPGYFDQSKRDSIISKNLSDNDNFRHSFISNNFDNISMRQKQTQLNSYMPKRMSQISINPRSTISINPRSNTPTGLSCKGFFGAETAGQYDANKLLSAMINPSHKSNMKGSLASFNSHNLSRGLDMQFTNSFNIMNKKTFNSDVIHDTGDVITGGIQRKSQFRKPIGSVRDQPETHFNNTDGYDDINYRATQPSPRSVRIDTNKSNEQFIGHMNQHFSHQKPFLEPSLLEGMNQPVDLRTDPPSVSIGKQIAESKQPDDSSINELRCTSPHKSQNIPLNKENDNSNNKGSIYSNNEYIDITIPYNKTFEKSDFEYSEVSHKKTNESSNPIDTTKKDPELTIELTMKEKEEVLNQYIQDISIDDTGHNIFEADSEKFDNDIFQERKKRDIFQKYQLPQFSNVKDISNKTLASIGVKTNQYQIPESPNDVIVTTRISDYDSTQRETHFSYKETNTSHIFRTEQSQGKSGIEQEELSAKSEKDKSKSFDQNLNNFDSEGQARADPKEQKILTNDFHPTSAIVNEIMNVCENDNKDKDNQNILQELYMIRESKSSLSGSQSKSDGEKNIITSGTPSIKKGKAALFHGIYSCEDIGDYGELEKVSIARDSILSKTQVISMKNIQKAKSHDKKSINNVQSQDSLDMLDCQSDLQKNYRYGGGDDMSAYSDFSGVGVRKIHSKDLIFHRFVDPDGYCYTGFTRFSTQKRTWQKHGKGLLYWPDRKIYYEGEFYKDQKQGYGIIYWRNGQAMYEGQQLNDLFNGTGVKFGINGTITEKGYWKLGRFVYTIPDLTLAYLAWDIKFSSENQCNENTSNRNQSFWRAMEQPNQAKSMISAETNSELQIENSNTNKFGTDDKNSDLCISNRDKDNNNNNTNIQVNKKIDKIYDGDRVKRGSKVLDAEYAISRAKDSKHNKLKRRRVLSFFYNNKIRVQMLLTQVDIKPKMIIEKLEIIVQ